MNKMLHWLDRYWHIVVIGGVIGVQLLVFLIYRENSYLTVQDNLDLFVAHFQVMNHYDGWFSHGKLMPMLGGISRNALSSEWNLYNILFVILPPFWAYMTGYFLKILLGMGSFVLLAKDIYKENFSKYQKIAYVTGLCYGILPLFPAYGLAFASIPLAVLILRKIYYKEGKIWYAALFVYPLVSYFSYFGFFLLAYLCAAVILLSIRDKKFCGRMVTAVFVLAGGFICFEYRLFAQMLFSDEVTIRASMVDADLNFAGVLGQIKEAFLTPVFHASSDHKGFVLPVILLYLAGKTVYLIRSRKAGEIVREPVLWVLLLILFNCTVHGLYFCGPFRRLFETLVPPLKGFQFNRTTFFNPFLWYAGFFLVLKGLYDMVLPAAKNQNAGKQPKVSEQQKGSRYPDAERRRLVITRTANLLACIAVAVILLTPAVYNEFYWTAYHQAYRSLKHTEVNLLNYREYYSEALMEEIKADIGYDGEYSAGYGLNPAVLEYSGIATLDGYLGLYAQSYKDEFTKLIRPSYDRVPDWQTYFGEWGARAYLYAGSGESIYNPYRNQPLSDSHLYLDGEQFRKMGGKYLFSRYEIDNGAELGFTLRSIYQNETSPYTIYLYEQKE